MPKAATVQNAGISLLALMLSGAVAFTAEPTGPRTLEKTLANLLVAAEDDPQAAVVADEAPNEAEEPPAAPKDDPLQRRLDAALAEYNPAIERAIDELAKEIEEEFTKATKKGDIDVARKCKAAEEALREEGTPPKDDFLKHAREHACRKITRAGAKLAAEFEAVAKECLKSGDLDRAEAVLSEKADLLAEMKAWKQIKTQGSPENQSAGNTPAPQVEGRQGVWLHDLQEKAVDGRRLDGVIRAAFPQDMVWFRKGAVRFGGEDIPFSIFLHPPTDGLSRVTFDVPLGVERLAGAVAVGDASEGRQATALTFKVLDQNDMPIWTSKLIFGKGKTEAFDVPLRGTKAISLVVMCPGDWAWAHAVWLGPKFFP